MWLVCCGGWCSIRTVVKGMCRVLSVGMGGVSLLVVYGVCVGGVSSMFCFGCVGGGL